MDEPKKEINDLHRKTTFFSKEEAVEFRDAYAKATDSEERSFRYNGETFDIVYAKYLISYLKMSGY